MFDSNSFSIASFHAGFFSFLQLVQRILCNVVRPMNRSGSERLVSVSKTRIR
jgi:hypothetical protein